MKKKGLVYDLPTRLFHSLFGILFLVSFTIGKVVNDETLLFSYHMISGLVMLLLVFGRIFWGFWGSSTARWSDGSYHPQAVMNYFKNLVGGKENRYVGHNPASSWVSILMILATLGLVATGLIMVKNGGDLKESLKEVHEIFANGFILLVIAHVAGVIFHTIRHKDPIAMSMIHGQKEWNENFQGQQNPQISKNHRSVALGAVVVILCWSVYLLKNFDTSSKTLKLFGQTLMLGENEQEGESKEKENGDSAEESESQYTNEYREEKTAEGMKENKELNSGESQEYESDDD